MKKILMSLMFVLLFAFSFGLSVQAAAVYDHEVTFDMNGGDYIHRDIDNFGDKLNLSSEPMTMMVFGDSTSAGTSTWFYEFGGMLAEELDNYSVQYRAWDTTTSSYDGAVSIQYGDQGDAYAFFEGISRDNATTMDSSGLSITGDIDIRAKIKSEPSSSGAVVGKWKGTELSYFLYYTLDTTGLLGKITLYWTEDGTTTLQANSGEFAVLEDTPIWIQATLDVDNGAAGRDIDYNYSYDNVTWTNVETDTVAGITSIYDSTSSVEIGGTSGGTATIFEGNIYAVEIRNGIDGEIVASPDFDNAFPSTVNSFKDLEGNIWIINNDLSVGNGSPGLMLLNGSITGSVASAYTADVLTNMTRDDIDLAFINFGHNYGDTDDYADTLEDFVDNIKIYIPDVTPVLVTQNAQLSPRTTAEILAQTVRMDHVRLVAARNDFAFIDSGAVLDSNAAIYIGADGVHPTTAGYTVWADQVYDLIKAGMDNTGASEITMLVEDGELIIEPDDPFKLDATFIGWYSDENLTDEWDMDTDLVQDDMTLYAKYSDSIIPGVTGGVALFAPAADTYTILGIAWYWYGVVAVGAVWYFGFTKKGRKTIGLK